MPAQHKWIISSISYIFPMKNTPNVVKSGIILDCELIHSLSGDRGEAVERCPPIWANKSVRSASQDIRAHCNHLTGPYSPPAPGASKCQGLARGMGGIWGVPFRSKLRGRGWKHHVQRGWEEMGSRTCSFDSCHLTWGSDSQPEHSALFSAREESLWELVFAFAVSRNGVFLDYTSKYGKLFVFSSLTRWTWRICVSCKTWL